MKEADLAVPSLICCISVFLIYYAYFYIRVIVYNDQTLQINKNKKALRDWVKRHVKKTDAASVQQTIQALRNTIFVGTFVGANAVVFSFNFLNTIDSSRFNDFDTVLFIKDARALVISILLFCSFLNWALVLRFASEVGFLLDSSSEATRLEVLHHDIDEFDGSKIGKITALTDRMVYHFSFGFRFMYASIPFAFLSVGPIALIIATVCILIYHYDHDFKKYTTRQSSVAQGSEI